MKAIRVWYSDRPEWRRANEQGHIELVRDYCLYVDGVPFWVPQKYVCNGASIPRPFWVLPGIGTPFEPINADGAWGHDPLFLTHALPFEVANEAAFQIWRQSGKSLWGARAMWSAVQSPAGRLAWRNNDDDKADLAAVRLMIEARPDKAKFESLWFAQAA